MRPTNFEESNKTLTKPEGMTDDECSALRVFSNGEQIISCWRMDWRDRIRCLFSGLVWLSVWSGHTSPPVRVSVDDPFVKSHRFRGGRLKSNA